MWRPCNLTLFSPCLTGPVDFLFASCYKGPRFKSPGGGGYLCETRILLLALSCYIGEPDVIDNFCGLVWGGLRPEPSLGPRADNVIISLDLTQLSCPSFTLAAGLPSGFTTDRVGCWGGALWRACNLTAFSPSLTGPVDYLFASRHKRPRLKSPGGYLCETGILLLVLACYTCILSLFTCCSDFRFVYTFPDVIICICLIKNHTLSLLNSFKVYFSLEILVLVPCFGSLYLIIVHTSYLRYLNIFVFLWNNQARQLRQQKYITEYITAYNKDCTRVPEYTELVWPSTRGVDPRS